MPKDYINFMLTGKIKTDYSDAAGTLMFDVKGRKFNADFVSKAGIDTKILPDAIESTGEVGTVTPAAARELGLSPNVKVIAGGADNSCAAIGNGIVGSGEAVISVGTSGTVVAFLEDINSEVTGAVHIFNYSYPGSMYAMGCMLSAGECFNWLHRNILSGTTMDESNILAEKVPIGSNKLIFLPYLFGERSPYTDANARGVFFGLSSLTGKGEMARAVMEGVAFGLKDMFLLVEGFADMDEIYITGGGAKSELWGKIICNVINRNLKVLNVEEGPAFGAALIAGVGADVFADFKSAKAKSMKVVKQYVPNARDAAEYEKFHAIYRELYAANKDIFASLAQLP
jgi:xylulokinase